MSDKNKLYGFYAAAGTARINNFNNAHASISEDKKSAQNSDDNEKSVTNTDETISESEDLSLPQSISDMDI